MGTVCGTSKTVTAVTLKITDHSHHNKYNTNDKVWSIVRLTNMWHRDKVSSFSNAVGEMLFIKIAKNFSF